MKKSIWQRIFVLPLMPTLLVMAAMLSLTAALIASFGENGPFRRTMLAICGAAISGIVLWLSISLIYKSKQRLRDREKQAV